MTGLTVNPTKKEKLVIRVIVAFGVISMAAFLYSFLRKEVIGYAPLYYLLIGSFIFTCVKVLYEWFHYLFITVPPTPVLERPMTVDIFTTFCAGEPYPMIVETLEAIQQIQYPHTAYLCDEADDPYLKKICAQLGVHHVTRTDKTDAKAGNINNALKISNGELCVVLDPDHTPFPGFLDPIIPHFNTPDIGFVQIVQAYKNIDEGFISKGAAQQTFQFYGPMMMTMNKYGTVQAIGANCTFRRAALDSINGHAAGLAEDMNTAMHLHARGWKSVYVPQVLALGLVPSTLSAYYKQQLKWARGVFELLVTTYVSKFRKFTLLQKIHYGTIPLYYFSGIVFLINFLIPILALFTDRVPLKMGVTTFVLAGLPLGFIITLARHYVQKWVAGEEERGFHMVGGLLAIGTWWIFILGLFYTIIRKKVNYVPTPKDGNEANNWPLNIPNIVVCLVSVIAIVYGLYNDWNPYMWFMAGLAALNCFILLLNIAASRQPAFKKYKVKHAGVNSTVKRMRLAKESLWIRRRRFYAFVRTYPAYFLIAVLAITLVVMYNRNKTMSLAPAQTAYNKWTLSGIFAPAADVGYSSMKVIKALSGSERSGFDIVSTYIPWGDSSICDVPVPLMDSIYAAGSVAMITWEPWQKLFTKKHTDSLEDGQQSEKNIFAKILAGEFDEYITRFSLRLKGINKPVFLRFAHETDNPFYPWSSAGGNTPDEYKKAWVYVHHLFEKQRAVNVIWVWNPWNPDTMEDFFPGREYVDWIGIDILDYAAYTPQKKSYTFSELYDSFRQHAMMTAGLPVIITEMGSLGSIEKKQAWLAAGLQAMKDRYPEINAFVFFNSGFDDNTVAGGAAGTMDWRIPGPAITALAAKYHHNSMSFESISSSLPAQRALAAKEILTAVRAVNYTSGHDWYANYHPLMKREILADFAEVKNTGMNTVKIYEYGVYNRNIFYAAKQSALNIIYTFWIPETIDFVTDNEKLVKLEQHILRDVEKLKQNASIVAWDLGNNSFQKLAWLHSKPEVFYQQKAYLNWISRLANTIKKIDASRPIVSDIEVDQNITSNAAELFQQIPALDGIGLICTEKSPGLEQVQALKMPYYFSQVSPALYLQQDDLFRNKGVVLTAWQDQQTWRSVNIDGLADINGNKRNDFFRIAAAWGSDKKVAATQLLPVVKIVRPALTVFAETKLNFSAAILHGNSWQLAQPDPEGFTFTWWLLRIDKFGKNVSMAKVGEGPGIQIAAPDNPELSKIYVAASKNGQTSSAMVSLNLPLN
ncbi:MAG: glycosyltransferase family 2 protein [Chitinophagaceae bacterium]